MKRSAHVLCLVASLLLFIMAGLHGSGFFQVQAAMEASDASAFLKEIVPPLFAHPSFHLLGLAGFGLLAIRLRDGAVPVLSLLTVLILADAGLAFYLAAWVPGLLLTVAAVLYFWAGRLKKSAA